MTGSKHYHWQTGCDAANKDCPQPGQPQAQARKFTQTEGQAHEKCQPKWNLNKGFCNAYLCSDFVFIAAHTDGAIALSNPNNGPAATLIAFSVLPIGIELTFSQFDEPSGLVISTQSLGFVGGSHICTSLVKDQTSSCPMV